MDTHLDIEISAGQEFWMVFGIDTDLSCNFSYHDRSHLHKSQRTFVRTRLHSKTTLHLHDREDQEGIQSITDRQIPHHAHDLDLFAKAQTLGLLLEDFEDPPISLPFVLLHGVREMTQKDKGGGDGEDRQ